MQNVAVIGAGIAGCAAAYELKKAGVKVTVFEKSSSIGGRTISFKGERLAFNTGAAFVTNFYRRTRAYIEELSLADQIVASKNADIFFVNQNKVVPFDVSKIGTFVVYPYLSLGEKIRVIANSIAMKIQKSGMDWVDPQALSQDDTETVAAFARRTFNENIYQYLIRGGIESYWYFSAEVVSAAMAIALQANALNAKFFTFAKGMDTIPLAIARQVEVRINAEVVGLEVYQQKQVLLRTSSGENLLFDGVVIATTADVAHALTNTPQFPISASQREYLSSQGYVAHIVIAYAVPKQAIPDLAGEFHPVGNWDYGAAAVLVRGVHHLQPDDDFETVVVYLTKDKSLTLLAESEPDIALAGWRYAHELCGGLPEEFADSKVIRRSHAIPIPAVGCFKAAAAFIAAQQAPVVFAGDYLTIPCIEGAIFTAQKAVAALLKPAS